MTFTTALFCFPLSLLFLHNPFLESPPPLFYCFCPLVCLCSRLIIFINSPPLTLSAPATCLDVGEVVGIVIGCLLLILIIVLLVVLIVFLIRRRRGKCVCVCVCARGITDIQFVHYFFVYHTESNTHF